MLIRAKIVSAVAAAGFIAFAGGSAFTTGNTFQNTATVAGYGSVVTSGAIVTSVTFTPRYVDATESTLPSTPTDSETVLDGITFITSNDPIALASPDTATATVTLSKTNLTTPGVTFFATWRCTIAHTPIDLTATPAIPAAFDTIACDTTANGFAKDNVAAVAGSGSPNLNSFDRTALTVISTPTP